MKSYTVNAAWDPIGWWVVSVPAVPGAFTQVRRLDEVRANATEVIELMTGDQPGTYTIELRTVTSAAS